MIGGAKRRRAIWTEVATTLGGTHQLPSRWWRGDEHITATVHGVPIKLDCYVVSTGKSSHVFTRVAAAYAHGPGPKAKVYKTNLFSAIGKVLGLQDVVLGDAAFDAKFVVKADNEAVVRRLWSPAAIAHMHAVADAQLASKPAHLELVAGGRWADRDKMLAAFALVGELAARDLYGIAALRALGEVVQPAGERPRVVIDTGARVVITAEDRDGHLAMVARADAQPAGAHTIDVVDGSAGQLAHVLPQGAHVHLPRVGSGMLTTAPLAFAWRDLELDPERLRAGAALLGAVAAGGAGFR